MPRQAREKSPTERRAHAAAAEAGIRWSDLALQIGYGSQDTLTRRLRDIDENDREAFPYERAEEVLTRIVQTCRLRDDFFALHLAADAPVAVRCGVVAP